MTPVPKMTCETCQKEIVSTEGYFTAFFKSGRINFHIQCRPTIYYQTGRDAHQLQLFEEKHREEDRS